VMRAKMGLDGRTGNGDDDDIALVEDWLALLQRDKADFTLAWRHLADAAEDNPSPLRNLFADRPALDAWLVKWRARCGTEEGATHANESQTAAAARAQAMRRSSPWLIARNHCVEEALSAASDENDFGPFEQLLEALSRPYEEHAGFDRFAKPAPESFTASYCTFCGT
jgi:serine/tyrosine/threonine adenylyltransferase